MIRLWKDQMNIGVEEGSFEEKLWRSRGFSEKEGDPKPKAAPKKKAAPAKPKRQLTKNSFIK